MNRTTKEKRKAITESLRTEISLQGYVAEHKLPGMDTRADFRKAIEEIYLSGLIRGAELKENKQI